MCGRLTRTCRLTTESRILALTSAQHTIHSSHLSSRQGGHTAVNAPAVSFRNSRGKLVVLIRFTSGGFISIGAPRLCRRVTGRRGFASSHNFIKDIESCFLTRDCKRFSFRFSIINPIAVPRGADCCNNSAKKCAVGNPRFVRLVTRTYRTISSRISFSSCS